MADYYAGGGSGGGGGGWGDTNPDYFAAVADAVNAASLASEPVTTSTTSPTSSYTGSTTPSYNQEDMDYLNSQQSVYERMLESLGLATTSGLSRLEASEAEEKQKATLANDRATRNFGFQRDDTNAGKSKAINAVDNNARTLGESVRRMLGMAGGVDSSAYKLAAPKAIAKFASKSRGNVMDSYGKNFRDLEVAESDTGVDFQNLLKEIADKRREAENQFRANAVTQEQGVQQSLAEIAAEKARLQGGSALSAMQPYRDRFMSLQSNLDGLNQYTPSLQARELSVKTPSLRDYVVDRQAINASKATGQTQYSPYSAFLNREDDEELQVR